MTRTSLLLTMVAAAALAGCNNDPVVVGGPAEDPANQAPVANGPVELPPAIQATKSYRCKDNSIVKVDWLSDGSARVRTDADQVGQQVKVGEGLTGTPEGSTVTYNGQSCKA